MSEEYHSVIDVEFSLIDKLITEVRELIRVIDKMKIPQILEEKTWEFFSFIDDLFIDCRKKGTHEGESEADSELLENGTTGQGK